MKTTSSIFIKEINAQIRVMKEALKEFKKLKRFKKQHIIQDSMKEPRMRL